MLLIKCYCMTGQVVVVFVIETVGVHVHAVDDAYSVAVRVGGAHFVFGYVCIRCVLCL